MLNVPTLWTVFVINFLALGLIWAYIARSYPAFDAARFWTGSAFIGAAGGAAATARAMMTESVAPLLAAGTLMVFAACLSAMGIQRFYGKPVSWRGTALIVALNFAGLAFFTFVHDSTSWRITVYTLAHSAPMMLTLHLLFSPQDGRINPGARLAGIVSSLILCLYAVRLAGNLYYGAGEFSFIRFTPAASVLILVLVFLAMSTNFGFLLMAVDRLRNEVADLALMDDLTGFANRRHLLQRLTEECGRSMRSSEPFALLVIDLDGFKAINDTHGHPLGDRLLVEVAARLRRAARQGAVFRYGGEEFAVLLPGAATDDAMMAAERLRLAVGEHPFELDPFERLDPLDPLDPGRGRGRALAVTCSLGVATLGPGHGAAELVDAADRALLRAKAEGKDRVVLADG